MKGLREEWGPKRRRRIETSECSRHNPPCHTPMRLHPNIPSASQQVRLRLSVTLDTAWLLQISECNRPYKSILTSQGSVCRCVRDRAMYYFEWDIEVVCHPQRTIRAFLALP